MNKLSIDNKIPFVITGVIFPRVKKCLLFNLDGQRVTLLWGIIGGKCLVQIYSATISPVVTADWLMAGVHNLCMVASLSQ